MLHGKKFASALRPAGALVLALGLSGTPARAQVSFPPVPLAGNTVGLSNFQSFNATCLSQVTNIELFSSGSNDCWGYVSPAGREYAIVCTEQGTTWVEVTDPFAPVVLAFYPGPFSTWRDAKVFEDHCYVVSEGGQGIQVFDMSQIDAGQVTYLGDVTVGGATNSHNVVIDEASGFLYRVGTGSGTLIYDLNGNKASPVFVTSWNGVYFHDAQAHTYTTGPAAGQEVLLGCAGSDSNALWVLDVTNKQNIVLLDQATYANVGYSHQGWLDENERYFYLNDEFDEGAGLSTTTYVFDVLDPSNATYVGKFDNGLPSVGHNGYVAGDLLYEANYTSGLRVFDLAASPTNPPEIAWVDTYPANNGTSYSGMWSCWPYFPSGVVLGSDRSEGLVVMYVGETLITIALAGGPPALVTPAGAALPVTVTEANPGDLVPGSATVHFDDGSGWQSAPLSAQGGTSYLAQLPALACGGELHYYFTAQSTNGTTWKEPFGGQNDPYRALIGDGQTVVFQDDFETNQGWTASNLGATGGDWDRGTPVNDPSWAYDPVSDSDGSGKCWVTENAAGNTDVDGGGVRLTSPVLDLSGGFPVVQYDYYLNLTDATGPDYIVVEARDVAGGGAWLEVARHSSNAGIAWRTNTLTGADFAAAGLVTSNQVQLRFDAVDGGINTIVEAGLDAFRVVRLQCGPAVSYCTPGTSASGCQATLSSSGTPSLSLASGFSVLAATVEGSNNGIFFFGWNGRQANPWGNGTSYQCVVPPVKRGSVLPKQGTNGACDGAFALDLNAFLQAKPWKAPPPAIPVQLQLWYRDPQSTSNQTTSLSDALEFQMAP